MNIIEQVKNKTIDELRKDSLALIQIENILDQRNKWKNEEKEIISKDNAQDIINSVDMEDEE